jgi:hypothetical protein
MRPPALIVEGDVEAILGRFVLVMLSPERGLLSEFVLFLGVYLFLIGVRAFWSCVVAFGDVELQISLS